MTNGRRECRILPYLNSMNTSGHGLRGNVTKDRLDEGIVWHLHEDQRLSEGLANELGSNRCFKIINNKYLTKNGL